MAPKNTVAKINYAALLTSFSSFWYCKILCLDRALNFDTKYPGFIAEVVSTNTANFL